MSEAELYRETNLTVFVSGKLVVKSCFDFGKDLKTWIKYLVLSKQRSKSKEAKESRCNRKKKKNIFNSEEKSNHLISPRLFFFFFLMIVKSYFVFCWWSCVLRQQHFSPLRRAWHFHLTNYYSLSICKNSGQNTFVFFQITIGSSEGQFPSS